MERINQLLSSLSQYVYKPNDAMWQDGLLRIDITDDSSLIGQLIQFEFASIEEKNTMRPNENVYDLNINSELDSLIKELKGLTSNLTWSTLVLEVRHDGSFIPHFELDGDEVFLSPLESDSTEYIITNLHNCLAYNAPDDYEWVIVMIEKLSENNGRATRGACFVKRKDKNAEDLVPGDNVYVQNLAMKLLDENRLSDTSGWHHAKIYIHKSGVVRHTFDK